MPGRFTVTVQGAKGKPNSTVTVQTGLTGNAVTEITSGVTVGQTLVIPSNTSSSTSSLLGGGGLPGGTSLLGGGR
jgi:hypothetical protein